MQPQASEGHEVQLDGDTLAGVLALAPALDRVIGL
jgi:hypothetical protein